MQLYTQAAAAPIVGFTPIVGQSRRRRLTTPVRIGTVLPGLVASILARCERREARDRRRGLCE
jgi:hypothetical protein